MQWGSANGVTIRQRPQEWRPHGYQRRAVDFLLDRGAAALFLDPGLGKTSIVLEAFRTLKDEGVAKRMLVVAPLLPCTETWPPEMAKWTQFRDLTHVVLHGRQKDKALKAAEHADVSIVNPEGLEWLNTRLYGRRLPWDTVVFDEITKFKNHRAKRSRVARKMTANCARRWGLTGTPAPNGYEDLFGQILLLDQGAAFGHAYTAYRDRYFKPEGFSGFKYVLAEGSAERIEERIRPIVLRMSAEDYLDLPPLVDDVRRLHMDDKTKAAYKKLKKEMLLELPEGAITAANAAAVYSKLAQMANGAVYLEETPGQPRRNVKLHDLKLDALESLIEELGGQQVLVAYEFQHDLERIRERFGDIPVLSSKLSSEKLRSLVRAWNDGEIRTLFAHPASAGHGLNLQGSGAAHICWFSATWNLELYDQFIKRVFRQGTTAPRIVNHILVMADTIDEIKLAALRDKDVTQERLLQSLNADITDDAQYTPAAGDTTAVAAKGDDDMAINKLRRQDEAPAAAEKTERKIPKGWGRPAPRDDEDEEADEAPASGSRAHRAAIREQISARDAEDEEDAAPVDPKSHFSKGVQDALAGLTEPDEDEEAPAAEPAAKPAKRSAKRAAPTVDKPAETKASAAPTEDKLAAIVKAFEVAVRAIMEA